MLSTLLIMTCIRKSEERGLQIRKPGLVIVLRKLSGSRYAKATRRFV
jgi:hypothetical protein